MAWVFGCMAVGFGCMAVVYLIALYWIIFYE